MRQLSQSLAANLAVLDKMFGTSADYYAKEITIYHCRGSILLFDGMASLANMSREVRDALWREKVYGMLRCPYRKPTQVDEERILRPTGEGLLRNSAS